MEFQTSTNSTLDTTNRYDLIYPCPVCPMCFRAECECDLR